MININKMHLFNQTAQNFYNPYETSGQIDLSNHLRNNSTGMKNGIL